MSQLHPQAQATFEVQILRPAGWRAVRAADSEAKAVKQALHYAAIGEVTGVRVVSNLKSGQRIQIIKAPVIAATGAPQAAARYRAPWWMPKNAASAWEGMDASGRDLIGRVIAGVGAVAALGGFAYIAERMVSNVGVLMN